MRARARTTSLALAGLLALGGVAACTVEEGQGSGGDQPVSEGEGLENEGEGEGD